MFISLASEGFFWPSFSSDTALSRWFFFFFCKKATYKIRWGKINIRLNRRPNAKI